MAWRVLDVDVKYIKSKLHLLNSKWHSLIQNKRSRSWLIGTLLTVVLLILLLSQLSINDIVSVFNHISVVDLVLSALLLLLANAVRAVRFQTLIDKSAPLLKIFTQTTTYNVTTAVLPAGLGEFYLPYAFEREFQLPVSQGMSILLLTRLADLVAIVGLLMIGGLSLISTSEWSTPFILMAILLLLILLLVMTRLDRVLHTVSRLAQPIAFLNPLSRFLANLSAAFGRLRTRSSLQLALTTLIQWLLVWVSQHLLFKSLGLDLHIGQTAFGMGVVYSLAVLPLSGVGNVGIRNIGWTLVLALMLNLPQKDAIAAAFANHLLTLLTILGIWIFGQLIVRLIRLPSTPIQGNPL